MLSQILSTAFKEAAPVVMLAVLVSVFKLWRLIQQHRLPKNKHHTPSYSKQSTSRTSSQSPSATHRSITHTNNENSPPKKAQIKGQIGEKLIEIEILRHLEKKIYHTLHNLIIPDGQGGTTQIDHIMVSPYGIFVIETKYFQGWIFGNEQQKRWLQIQYGKKYPFQNPIHQNHKHIKALSFILQLPQQYFHSIIVFPHRQVTLKTHMPANICLLKDFIPYIRQFQHILLPPKQIQIIYADLVRPEYQATEEHLNQHINSLIRS